MTEVFEPTDTYDRRLARRATGVLAAFNAAGVLEPADVHVATRAVSLAAEGGPDGAGDQPGDDDAVRLAVALAVRAIRSGSVCADLGTVADLAPGVTDGPVLPWPEPDPDAWAARVAGSAVARAGVVRVEGRLVYLDRYHRLEQSVCDELVRRVATPVEPVDEAVLAASLERVRGDRFSAEQEAAATAAVRAGTTVLTGGPGSGKTTTIARLLVLLAAQAQHRGERMTVALAAPTGKAATRLQQAVLDELAADLDPADAALVGRPTATTLHRLLGWRPDNATRFRHHRGNRLSHDVVVVDECSMVDLTMMERLLEAVRPESRLVLVGDPRQLTSVGAGAVLSDVVEGFADLAAELAADGRVSPVASLVVNHRSTPDIEALAAALRAGDPDGVLAVLRAPSDEVEFVETDDPADAVQDETVPWAQRVLEAAEAGDAEAALAQLDTHRLLCAHRDGPYGVRTWNRRVERWLAEATERPVLTGWYPGRPLLVTSNDHALGVYNGETGVAVRQPDGRVRAVIAGSGGHRDLAPGRLDAVDTMHAMTIHKSQGSQAERVTVLLPDEASRLLTRELFYTAVTRAQQHVRVVGTEAAVRAAVERRAQRATGLRQRLRAAAR